MAAIQNNPYEAFAAVLNKADAPALVLYDHPKVALCGWRLHTYLQHLGIPYEVKTIDLSKGEQKSEEFLKINPRGKVPALVDNVNQVTICESLAILQYLAATWGKGGLFPHKNAQDFARSQELIFRFIGCLVPTAFEIGHLIFGAPLAENAVQNRVDELKHWEGYLDGRTWLVAEEFGVNDILLMTEVHSAQLGGMDLEKIGFKNLAAWWARVKEVEAVKANDVAPAHYAWRDGALADKGGLPDLYSKYYQ